MRLTPEQQAHQDMVLKKQICGAIKEAFKDGVVTHQEIVCLPFSPGAVTGVLAEMLERGEITRDVKTGDYRTAPYQGY